MPTEDPYSESALRDVGEQLRDVRRLLGYPQDAGGRSLSSPTMDRNDYMRRVRKQAGISRAPDREDHGDDPFGNYLADVFNEIKEGAERLKTQASQGEGYPFVGGADVICCVLQGIYEIARDEDLDDDLQSVRGVAEEDIRKWVRLVRELLVAFRSVLTSKTAAGTLQLDLSILKKDLTAMILEGIYAGVTAILFAVHELMADFARQVDQDVTAALASTNCAPLMRMWSAIFNLIFGAGSGLIGRTRTMLRDVILSQSRKRSKSAPLNAEFGREISSERKARRVAQLNDLIEILDAILASLSIFTLCRIPDESGLNESDEEDADGSDGSGDEDESDDRRDDDREDRDDDDRSGRDGSGSGSSTRPSGSLTEIDDPQLGRVSVLDPNADSDDLLYFTPTNIAKLLTSRFDISREEALDMAREQDCRSELSDQTETVLREVGLIDPNETE